MGRIAIGPLGIVPRFVDWWLGEIGGLVPQALKRRFAASGGRIVLFPEDDTAGLYFETGENVRLLGRVAIAGARAASDLRDVLRRQSLDRAVSTGKLGVCLRIPAVKALRTEIELPLAAERNLEQVISFELDRHTPFRADQVLFSARTLERNIPAQRLRIEILLVPRPIVEEMVANAQRLGLEPSRVDIAEDLGHRAVSDNLLRAALPRTAGRRDALLLYGLAGLATILAIAAVVAPIVRARQAVEALEQQFAAVKHVALREAALQKEIDVLRKSEVFLVDKKRAAPTVSALLLETTRLIPDTTWLDDWRLSGKELQLAGVSQSASSLVGLLEQSKLFSHTTFLSSVTRDADGHEHFDIATQVTRGDKP